MLERLKAELDSLPNLEVRREDTLYPIGVAMHAIYRWPDGRVRSWWYHDSIDPRHPIERLHENVMAFYAAL